MKLWSVKLGNVQKISGSDGRRHGRSRLGSGQRRQPGLVCASGAVPHRGRILGIGQGFRILRIRKTGYAGGQTIEGGGGRLRKSSGTGQKDRKQGHSLA